MENEKKIAIPIWGNRVSPVFETAVLLLVADVHADGNISSEKIELAGLTPFQKIQKMTELGIDIFACGAITRPFLQALTDANINTIPFVCGNVEKIIHEILNGHNIKVQFAMPGCRNRHRRRKRNHQEKW